MILWLNGAFGIGKTRVARELVAQLPGARLVDPERIGWVMRRTFWRNTDYQAVPLWRRLVRWQIVAAARTGPVVVPMTVVDPLVRDALTAPARVFLLVADRAEIARRIAESGEAEGWRMANLDRCLAAFARGGFGEPIATDGCTPRDVAARILDRL